MAFMKTGIAVTPTVVIDPKAKGPEVGEEKDGLVWDGLSWVPREEWARRDQKKGT